MNPLLVAALDSLNTVVNVSTGLAHPLDECKAKELFKAMYKEGVALDKEEIYEWALAHQWDTRHANELAELGYKIGQGGRVVVKHKRDWAAYLLPKWKETVNKMEK